MSIDNLISGAVLVALLFGFLGMVFWAYSKKRHDDFEFMGRLPLDDDNTPSVASDKSEERYPNVK